MKIINDASQRDLRPSRQKLFILSAIIFVAVAVRIAYLLIISKYPNFNIYYPGLDAELYHLLAQRVAGGDLLLGSDVYYYSPFFAYLLGALYALFGVSTWVPRIFNIFMGSATVWFMYAYTRSFFESRKVGYIAACLAALYGPFIVFDTGALKSTSGLFFMTASLYFLSLSHKSRKLLLWLITGVFTGLAMIDFGHMSLFIIALCVWLLSVYKGAYDGTTNTVNRDAKDKINRTQKRDLSFKRRLSSLAPVIAGICFVVAPFTMRNYIVAKDFVLTACTSGIHLFIGNHEGAWGGYNRIQQIRPNPAGHYYDAEKLAEDATGRDLKASEVSRFWKNQAISYIKKNPDDFLALCVKRIFLSLHPYEIDNNENFQYLKSISSCLSCFLTFGMLMPIGIMGMILALPRYKDLFPLYLFFVCYLLGLSVSFVTWRYRIPLTLALFPFAGFGITRIISMIKCKKLLPAAAGLSLCLGIFIFFHLNPIKSDTRQSAIRRAEAKMDVCKRESDLLKQRDRLPLTSEGKRVQVWLELAGLRVTQYDEEGATRYLKEALKEYPDSNSLKANLEYLLKPD